MPDLPYPALAPRNRGAKRRQFGSHSTWNLCHRSLPEERIVVPTLISSKNLR
jgi:hypothetical protein